MRTLKLLGAVSGALAIVMTGSLYAGHTASAAQVSGYVYVNDNTAGTNTIAGFARYPDGSLTAIPGSPFATGGAGTGAGIGSQGALQATANGHYLLAVDAGSNQISVLRIRPDGTLREVSGSPVSSNGIKPVSIAVHDRLVYVANDGDGSQGSNYTGFTLSGAGSLTALSNSTVALAPTASPGDILFNGTGSSLIGTEVGTSLIDSFTVNRDGTLTPAPGSPFAAQAAGPFGSEFRPTNPTELYVSNAHAGANNGTISAYSVGDNGNLNPIGPSPYPDLQTAPCWVEITHDGRYLFTVNTASSSISQFRILGDGSLALLASTALNDPSNLGPFDLRLTSNDRYLYVVDDGRDAVSALAVNDGNLRELPGSPVSLPVGAAPFGIVVI